MIFYSMEHGIGNYWLLEEPGKSGKSNSPGPSQALLFEHYSLLDKRNSLPPPFDLDTAPSNRGYIPWPISLSSLLRLFYYYSSEKKAKV